ncbi:DUF2793 domain-containing protein [Sandarakinorhabdus sp. DWP1-3-1]|uniref:DUF2793 domain-containing protein n=1 Tax=Sandarakinorhabdus sp. DWP1-3-1 TaxID=2804627 RepID=UPI003CF26570
MDETPRHRLPLLSAGQAQKEITHNEALTVIDRLLQVGVATRGLGSPPGSPTPGLSYIVDSPASGIWTGQEGKLASHDGFGWIFTDPVRGCLAWIVDEGVFSVFDGAWSTGGWPASGLAIGGRQVLAAPAVVVAPPTGGAVVDAEARAALAALIAALQGQAIIL